ncbi:MAG: hypothetical protein WC788_00090 [Candidatus Paceibacterota bacterium]|jgi:hypothetical protein
MSLTKKILDSKKPFTLFHTYSASEDIVRKAIGEKKSMDLDVCVDGSGKPYLGHSEEYYEKSGEARAVSMPIWEAVGLVSKAMIPVVIDCKHPDAWPVVEKTVSRIGAQKCLVHSFAEELRFGYSRREGEPDYLTEWSNLGRLLSFKKKFPQVSTCASCKWLPDDLLISDKYENLLGGIRKLLKDNRIDTVCLNVPNGTFSDGPLKYFLSGGIICHVGIDGLDVSKFTEIYIGETDDLDAASRCNFFDNLQ